MSTFTFKSFISSDLKRSYIYETGLEIYVRRNIGLRGPLIDFELANISAHKPGKGKLTKFLDKYEQQYGLYVENIMSNRFRRYLERRGYKQCKENSQSLLKERT